MRKSVLVLIKYLNNLIFVLLTDAVTLPTIYLAVALNVSKEDKETFTIALFSFLVVLINSMSD